MLVATLVTAAILAFLLALISPKLASVMIWPILFLYPHNWWYHHQFLPMNIGGDDLFCLILFTGVVIRRNVLQRVAIRMGFAFWVVTAFTVIAAVANFAGVAKMGGADVPDAIKGALKPAVYWALFFAILHCIDGTRDLKIQISSFTLGAALGAGLVIAQGHVPELLGAFAQPRPYSSLDGFRIDSRGAGAFLNPNAAACVLGSSLLLAIAAVRLQQRLVMKAFMYGPILLLLVGILYTRSRSGLLALVISVFFMACFSRSRGVVLLAAVGGIAVAGLLPEATGLFGERLASAYVSETGMTSGNVAGRVASWKTYLAESSLSDYLVGQGAAAGVARFGTESHSAYVSLLTVYGAGGAIWAVATLIGFLRRVFSVRNSPDPVLRTVASACLWTLLLWGIYAFTADAISSSYTRYLLFYLVVLADRTHALRVLPFTRPVTVVQRSFGPVSAFPAYRGVGPWRA
jgi:hypothetical protein